MTCSPVYRHHVAGVDFDASARRVYGQNIGAAQYSLSAIAQSIGASFAVLGGIGHTSRRVSFATFSALLLSFFLFLPLALLWFLRRPLALRSLVLALRPRSVLLMLGRPLLGLLLLLPLVG